MRMNALDVIATILVIVGGINWGLVGFFDYNLVDALFGAGTAVTRTVYALVGVAAVYMAYPLAKGVTGKSDRQIMAGSHR